MKKKTKRSWSTATATDAGAGAGELRRQAEQRLAERRPAIASRPAEDQPRLVQELEIHQFELEIQNEELQRARTEQESLLAQYMDLYDFAPLGYFALGRDGGILAVNLAGAHLLGIERARLVSRRFADFIALPSRPAVSAFLATACEAQETQTCEAQVLTPAGRSAHVHLEAVAVNGGSGCRVALVDTTERVRAQKALETSEVRYRSLFESSKEGLLLLDAATGFLMAVNPTLCDWLGHPAEFFHGKALWEIGAFQSVVDSREAFLEMQQRGRLEHRHLVLAGEGGRHVDVELLSHAYRVASGNVLQLSLRDIGERLRSERTLREMEEQRRRVQVLEAIGHLAGGVAHELNNKLSVILGCVELLRRGLPQDGKERRRLDHMEEAGEHAVALTQQLLAFARKQVLQPTVWAPSALVADTLPRLSPSLGASVQVVLKLASEGRVRVDRVQLEAVLILLIGNAQDAMRDGGVVTIETEDVELAQDLTGHLEVIPPGRYVALSVSDTGSGLGAVTMDRIFEPFYSTKPEGGGGKGMSLAAVYGTVKQSGGYLLVESEPERGATFRIYLPRESDEDMEAPERGAAEVRRKICTVLVVDDEAAIGEMIAEAFRDEGYDVRGAKDGDEAVAMASFQNGPIDLLLTDVILPGLSGPIAAERIRKVWPEMRVLYMSGHPRDELSDQGVLESADGLIQKPFTMPELLRRVMSLGRPESPRVC